MRSLFFSLVICGSPLLLAAQDNAPQPWLEAARTWKAGEPSPALRQVELATREALNDPAKKLQLEPALVRLLQPDATPETRAFAAQQAAMLDLSPASLAALEPLLRCAHSAPLACLSLSGSRQASPVLLRALEQAEPAARLQLITALGNRRDAQAVPALLEIARQSATPEASSAVAALGKIASDKAVRELSRMWNAHSRAETLEIALINAADQLALKGKNSAARKLAEPLITGSARDHIRRGAFLIAARTDHDQGKARLQTALRSKDPVLRPAALAAMSQVPGMIDWAATHLQDLPAQDRPLLVLELAETGSKSATKAVASALRSPDPALRTAALEAAVRYWQPAYAPALVQLLQEKLAPEQRRTIETALGGFPANASLDQAVLDGLNAAGPDAQASLLTVLGRRPHPQRVEIVSTYLASQNPAVARSAWKALAQNATQNDLPAMLKRLAATKDPGVKQTAGGSVAAVLSRGADRNGISREIESLVRADSSQAEDLLPLLPLCADAHALQVLQACAKDPKTRNAALESLGEWPDGRAWDPLYEAYATADGGNRASLFGSLVRLLGEMNAKPDPQLVERYRTLLGSARNENEIRALLGALGGANSPEALALAQAHLSKPGVKAEAAAAIRRIAGTLKASNPAAAEQALKDLQL